MKVFKWIGIAILSLVLLVAVVAAIGLALPQDHVASRSVTVNRPIEEVWTAITDVQSHPSWRPSVSRVEVLNQEPRRWREIGRDGTLTLQAVESRPPSRFVSEIADQDLPFGGRWIYELKSTPAGTELTITEQGQVYNPVFRFVSRFIIGHTATMDTYLSDLLKKFGGTR